MLLVASTGPGQRSGVSLHRPEVRGQSPQVRGQPPQTTEVRGQPALEELVRGGAWPQPQLTSQLWALHQTFLTRNVPTCQWGHFRRVHITGPVDIHGTLSERPQDRAEGQAFCRGAAVSCLRPPPPPGVHPQPGSAAPSPLPAPHPEPSGRSCSLLGLPGRGVAGSREEGKEPGVWGEEERGPCEVFLSSTNRRQRLSSRRVRPGRSARGRRQSLWASRQASRCPHTVCGHIPAPRILPSRPLARPSTHLLQALRSAVAGAQHQPLSAQAAKIWS